MPDTQRHREPGKRAQNVARKILRDYFGSQPGRIVREEGGLSNLVFGVRHKREDFILRIGRGPEKFSPFLKEQWVAERARGSGVPVPEILEVGREPLPHMVLRKSRGAAAASHPERMRIVRELGRYAAAINSIRTHGYGEIFDWSRDARLSRRGWKEFLEEEYHLEARLRALNRLRALPAKKADRIRSILEELGQGRRRPVLNHGDLRLKNALVDEGGRITAILDWEMAVSSLAPEWELSVALHDLSIDEKEAFVEGYGLSARRMEAAAPAVKAFNILNYIGAIEHSAKRGDTGRLQRNRLRLRAILDLYCV